MTIQRSSRTFGKKRKKPLQPRTWRKTATLFFSGTLLIDLGTYFAWTWWIFPVAFIGILMMNDAIGRKFLGLKNTGCVVLSLFVFCFLVAVKLWSPDLFATWEEHHTPLKWILP